VHPNVPSVPYACWIGLAAITTGGVVAIVIGAVTVIAGAFYALVEVQGARIADARTDFTQRVQTLDEHLGTRMDDMSTRLEASIASLGDRLEGSIRETHAELNGRIDTIAARLDHLEGEQAHSS
jgi:hypothetical protein